jgi:hypothetical protein
LDGGSARRKVATGHHKQNKRTQISIPRVGFEPTIPVFEWAKIVHALDRATTVIGLISVYRINILFKINFNNVARTAEIYTKG